jgi:low density lipoprotein-related protein 2
MFWADAGSIPKIETAWMDGNRRKPLITSNVGYPTGITIDYAMDHAVFWVDAQFNTVEMMKRDGTGRKTILSGDKMKHPVSLDVFESQLYWVTRDSGELFTQDKFGRGVPVLVERDLVNPTSIKSKLHYIFTQQTTVL